MNLWSWKIFQRTDDQPNGSSLPGAVITPASPLSHPSMPREVALLLPNRDGRGDIGAAISIQCGSARDIAVGLFLADPFLRHDREAERLSAAGARWVANLPTIQQQDVEFERQLEDVNLDHRLEMRQLARFKEAGFRVIASVTTERGAEAAVHAKPDGILVLPRVAEFAAGFPSARQRGAAVTRIGEYLAGVRWRGALLMLADTSEARHPSLWPRRVDGVVGRPVALDDLQPVA